MKRFIRRIGLFVCAAFLLAPAALAQGNQQQQQPQAPDVEVSDAELQTVAELYLKVEPIQAEYLPKMRKAQQSQNREQFMTLRKEFQEKVNAKLKAEEDISPDRFNKVMRAAQADQELRKRLSSAIETARGDSTGGGNGNGDGGSNS